MADRTRVLPVTLSFVRRNRKLLLLRVPPAKHLFGGLLNGVGGHVLPGENVAEAALREIREETGLRLSDPVLRAVIHQFDPEAPRLMFVFRLEAPLAVPLQASSEGKPDWFDLDALPRDELVRDLDRLIPLALASGAPAFGTSELDPRRGARRLLIHAGSRP